jgi:hypothetical protein
VGPQRRPPSRRRAGVERHGLAHDATGRDRGRPCLTCLRSVDPDVARDGSGNDRDRRTNTAGRQRGPDDAVSEIGVDLDPADRYASAGVESWKHDPGSTSVRSTGTDPGARWNRFEYDYRAGRAVSARDDLADDHNGIARRSARDDLADDHSRADPQAGNDLIHDHRCARSDDDVAARHDLPADHRRASPTDGPPDHVAARHRPAGGHRPARGDRPTDHLDRNDSGGAVQAAEASEAAQALTQANARPPRPDRGSP